MMSAVASFKDLFFPRLLDTGADTREKRSLVKDERGAVMFVGVFMACFLIGSLWFLFGVGDAVVRRDVLQEATDSGLFASSVIHAKGMNVISFLNCFLFAITFIWIIICLIVDILLLLIGLAVASLVGVLTIPSLVRAVYFMDNTVAKNYKRGMKVVMPATSLVQTGVAYLAPWGGMLAGATVSNNYKDVRTITFSPSLIPGTTASMSKIPVIGKVFTAPKNPVLAGATEKLGLPVINKPMQFLCDVVSTWVLEKIFGLMSQIPLAGRFISRLQGFVQGLVAGQITSMHCAHSGNPFAASSLYDQGEKKCGRFNAVCKAAKKALDLAMAPVKWMLSMILTVYDIDKFWKEDGPKEMYTPAKNGNEWMQVYGLTISQLQDTSSKNVQRAAYRFTGTPAGADTNFYTAQGEFYYDCKGKWISAECNGQEDSLFGGPTKSVYSHALYNMKWRAREVRYKGFLAGVGRLIADWLGQTLSSSGVVRWVQDKIAQPLAGAVLGKAADYLFKGGSRSQFDQFYKKIIKGARDAVKPVSPVAEALH
jgi:hypothetical protein